jgi:hypothetical protein
MDLNCSEWAAQSGSKCEELELLTSLNTVFVASVRLRWDVPQHENRQLPLIPLLERNREGNTPSVQRDSAPLYSPERPRRAGAPSTACGLGATEPVNRPSRNQANLRVIYACASRRERLVTSTPSLAAVLIGEFETAALRMCRRDLGLAACSLARLARSRGTNSLRRCKEQREDRLLQKK